MTKLRLFYNHPNFIETFASNVETAFTQLAKGNEPRLVFTAHSIPLSMAATSEYESQLLEASRLVAELLDVEPDHWDLAFQSRSGPPSMPWLEPDINDHLTSLAHDGTSDVVIAPLGFMSDHMEVLFDLDTQAKQTAEKLGLGFARASTVGNDARIVSMIRELVQERSDGVRPRSLGTHGPWPNECPENHCAIASRAASTH